MKKCTRCGEEYPETDEYFPRTKNTKSGLVNYCKGCHAARIREWQHNHPDRMKFYRDKSKAADPERFLQYGRDYRARKRAELAEKDRRIAELEAKLNEAQS